MSHPWPKTVADARAIQNRLRNQIVTSDRFGKIRRVTGVDVGFEKGGRITRAAAVALTFPELELCDQVVVREPTCFPYVPGYLSFREAPAVLAALKRLRSASDLLLCDGQGFAHPRRFGLACHLGLLTDTPSIGVAKSRLIGEHREPGMRKGDWVPLTAAGETIGAVLRTRDGISPVYVSIGHRISLETAVDFVLCCTTNYRLPETTRRAHHLASHGAKPGGNATAVAKKTKKRLI